ncbi:MAG: hypothetical protein A2Y72_06470 [Chloroflexi bacterium RBG_13_53_26]|nr:MAG: hypothetical protein A2Y72_06470 [Chloroflexi bacterium RBG_13_53_26]
MDDNKDKTNDQSRSDSARKRPSLRAVFTNMKVNMPLHRKLYLVFRNNWIKIWRRQNCCGHLGEPGC